MCPSSPTHANNKRSWTNEEKYGGSSLGQGDVPVAPGDEKELPNELVEAVAKDLRAPPEEFRAASDKRKSALGDVPLQIDEATSSGRGNPPKKQLKNVKTTGRGVDMTEKTAYLLDSVKKVVPLQSHLVGRGNSEDTDGFRADSPTGGVDAHNLVLYWAAQAGVKVKVADITNAYLQGMPMDRILLYRITKGGIPEEGIEDEQQLLRE